MRNEIFQKSQKLVYNIESETIKSEATGQIKVNEN